MSVVVKLDTSRLDRITEQLKPRAKRIVKVSAFKIEAGAKINAPVDTGALRGSISAEEKGELLWWIQDGVEYGIHQELGTSRMSAHPFLTPAAEAERSAFNSAWAELFL